MRKDGKRKEKTGTVCLIDWATDYLNSCKERFVEKTYKEKHSTFKRFFKEINPHMAVDALSAAAVQAYLIKQKKERSGYASNKDRKNLLAGWNWGCYI
ncbi:hypothetical protein [uncultured Desulfobacter sp.]|uniref:hypothetical protein n=1 Tax=uncultured Desulfobacter sp. TaxID=240139 RepID=UPI0029F48ED9|nr:hypothetical protein [uncultured Desulfobacter sp.]